MSAPPRIQLVVDVELAEDALASEVDALRRFVERRVARLELVAAARARVALRLPAAGPR